MQKIILLILVSKLAFAGNNTCWQNEVNARTKQLYSDENEYNQHKLDWQKKGLWANPLQLIKAYKVYSQEKANSLALETDKMGHCYMGCRIRQRTDVRTVRYVAWLKETQDISDCNPETHFEVADFNATVMGGSIQAGDAATCVQKCREDLPKIGLQ